MCETNVTLEFLKCFRGREMSHPVCVCVFLCVFLCACVCVTNSSRPNDEASSARQAERRPIWWTSRAILSSVSPWKRTEIQNTGTWALHLQQGLELCELFVCERERMYYSAPVSVCLVWCACSLSAFFVVCVCVCVCFSSCGSAQPTYSSDLDPEQDLFPGRTAGII